MNSVFAFRCWTPLQPLPSSTLVAFCGPNEFSNGDLTTAISEATQRSLAPEAVYLLYPQSNAAAAQAALGADEDAFAPLTAGTTIGLYEYAPDGSVALRASLRGAAPAELPLDDIRRQGLTTLFRSRGGMLESGPTAHFVKPSNTVDTRFLRAAHALAEGAEIFFAAFWLLPHLKSGTRYVHVDTSGIASVVMAAMLMRQLERLPVLRTFHSYSGMLKHSFSRDRLDLVLISASQSGNMAAEIRPLVSDETPVLTLFSTAPVSGPGVLCDLNLDRDRNARGFPPPERVEDLSSSRPIKLISEQFLVEPEQPRAIVPGTKKAPAVVENVISMLQGKRVFSAYRSAGRSLEPKGIWVDVERLQQTKPFQEWVAKTVRMDIPAATRAIIYPAAGPSGKALAEAVLKAVQTAGGRLQDVELLSLDMIEEAEPKWPSEEVPIVVTGGATGHGAELQAISRALRSWAPNSYRIYLSSATVPSSKRTFALLESNLRFPSHRFISMFEVVMDRAQAAASWADERQFLLEREDALPRELSQRLDELSDERTGLVDNLFLEGSLGRLRLRNNFAFWPVGTPCEEASQADVFVSMACIIENLRSGDVAYEQRLINDPQTHSVISAEAFSRYNDGVIQSSILRCALPVELNYRDAPEQSSLLVELIKQMTDLADRDQGEALTEFLIALALKRLQLADDDMSRLRQKLRTSSRSLNTVQAWLAQQIDH